jgi:hydroxymethylglutaryl-CoA lyase
MTRERIEIVEVSPRDGLQNESVIFSTEEKVALIEGCFAAGLRRIEVASFVNPKRVPQMADAEAVIAQLTPEIMEGAIGLVLNERGLERALAAGLREINYVVPVTEGFSQANQGISVADNLAMAVRVLPRARAEGLRTSVTLSVAFGCPFEGEVPTSRVTQVASELLVLEPDELALGDTIGVAVPRDVTRLIEALADLACGVRLRCHFHNTRGTGLANAMAAVDAGVRVLDASLGGIGGCPFAPRATGNIATEDLAWMLTRCGFDVGMEIETAFPMIDFLGTKLGRPTPGLLSRAGLFPAEDHGSR